MRMIKIGRRTVGDNQPTFITFEAGPTHDGLESAKDLIRLASEAGADAIKFQIIDPDRLVADKKMLFQYEVLADRATGKLESVSEPLYDILKRRALTHQEWADCKAYADKYDLAFFATIGFEDEIQLLDELGCDSLKIASGDVTHTPLIRAAAKTGKCIQLDTGNSTLGEIEVAVEAIRREGNENIVIHHCPSGYPARDEGINLRVIQTLRQMFDYPIAFSDHSPGWEIDIAAVALGADLVEKTITVDRTIRSVEHVMSVEPPQLSEFVETIRRIEKAMGSKRRVMSFDEESKRDRVRRSIFLARNERAGTYLRDARVEFRRPGDGLLPEMAEKLSSLRLKRDLPAGHKLELSDLS